MRNSLRLAAAGAALAAAVSMTSAANAATASANATAEILSSLTVVNDTGLDFAQVAVNGAGTVVVGTGAVSDSCSANLICAGSKQKATFTVTGARDMGVVGSVQETSITLTSGGNTMTLDQFSMYFPTGTTLTAASGSIGTTVIEVGGRLNVAAAQASGVYNGTFNVDVSYN